MLLAILLAIQAAPTREAPPVLQFPTSGLDDSAAYEGYTARLYRDSRRNSVEIYIEGKTGRVVHLWADGLNESIGFTVRDSGGQGGQGPEPATRLYSSHVSRLAPARRSSSSRHCAALRYSSFDDRRKAYDSSESEPIAISR